MGTVANLLVGAGTISLGDVDVGYTDDGLTIGLEKEFVDLEADQSIGILGKVKVREVCLIKTNLLEPTLTNLNKIWDAGTVSSGILSFGGNSQVTEHELVFVGTAPGTDVTRTVTIYKAVSIEPGEHSYKKGEKTMIPVTFQAIIDTSKPVNQRYGNFVDA